MSQSSTRPIVILAGAPQLTIDAVRYMSVRASGGTAQRLAASLRAASLTVQVISAQNACPQEVDAWRYITRADLDAQVQRYLKAEPHAVLVSSAAINDYHVQQVERRGADGASVSYAPGSKLPSGGEEVIIRLRPAPKLIDQLPAWGHQGPLVAFKYEDAQTVIASAQALAQRCAAPLVVANSLCARVQALVRAEQVDHYADRPALEAALAQALRMLAAQP